MNTEEKIVYSILNTAHGALMNDDKRMNERLVRSYLQTYRAALLRKHSFDGVVISDECFQSLGEVNFQYLRERQFAAKLPKVIQLRDRNGIYVDYQGENIPVVNSEEFSTGIKNIINKYHPKAKFVGDQMTVYIGQQNTAPCENANELNAFVSSLEDEILFSHGQSIPLNVTAVLDNPDDAPDYDWTVDPYPFPSELVPDMVTEILSKQYGIFVNAKTDKVTDGRNPDQNEREN